MDGFGGFILTFFIFIFAIRWLVVKRDGGSLCFPTCFSGRNRKNSFYDDSFRRSRNWQSFISDDDSFINNGIGLTNAGSFRDYAPNPATGLPMVNGIGSVDIMGNCYGMDSSDHISTSSFGGSSLFGSGFGDSSSFSSSSSLSDGFNSGFGSGSGISDL